MSLNVFPGAVSIADQLAVDPGFAFHKGQSGGGMCNMGFSPDKFTDFHGGEELGLHRHRHAGLQITMKAGVHAHHFIEQCHQQSMPSYQLAHLQYGYPDLRSSAQTAPDSDWKKAQGWLQSSR